MDMMTISTRCAALLSLAAAVPLLPERLGSIDFSLIGEELLITEGAALDDGERASDHPDKAEIQATLSQCELHRVASAAAPSFGVEYRACVPRNGYNGTVLLALPQTRAFVIHAVQRLGLLNAEESQKLIPR